MLNQAANAALAARATAHRAHLTLIMAAAASMAVVAGSTAAAVADSTAAAVADSTAAVVVAMVVAEEVIANHLVGSFLT